MSFGLNDSDSSTSSSSTQAVDASQDTTSTSTSQLSLSDDAINSIIDDVLSASGGLADIFSEANVAGIYDSSVAESGTSDLLANIASEIAELTGTTTTTSSSSTDTTGYTATSGDSDSDETGFNLGFSL